MCFGAPRTALVEGAPWCRDKRAAPKTSAAHKGKQRSGAAATEDRIVGDGESRPESVVVHTMMASNNQDQGQESVVPHSQQQQQQQLVRAILYPCGRMLHAQRKEQQFLLDLMDEFESQVKLGNYVCNLTTVRNHILSVFLEVCGRTIVVPRKFVGWNRRKRRNEC